MDISARALPDRVGLGGLSRSLTGLLQGRAERGQLLLDPGEALIQGLQLAADVGHGLDRGGPEPLGLPVEVAKLAVEEESQEAAGCPAQPRNEGRKPRPDR